MTEQERVEQRIEDIKQEANRQLAPLKARLEELKRLEREALEQKTGVRVGASYRISSELLEFMYTSPYNRDDKQWLATKYARFSVTSITDEEDGVNCQILTPSGWTVGGIPAILIVGCEVANEHSTP